MSVRRNVIWVALAGVAVVAGAAVLYVELTKPSLDVVTSPDVKLNHRATDTTPVQDSITKYKEQVRD